MTGIEPVSSLWKASTLSIVLLLQLSNTFNGPKSNSNSASPVLVLERWLYIKKGLWDREGEGARSSDGYPRGISPSQILLTGMLDGQGTAHVSTLGLRFTERSLVRQAGEHPKDKWSRRLGGELVSLSGSETDSQGTLPHLCNEKWKRWLSSNKITYSELSREWPE